MKCAVEMDELSTGQGRGGVEGNGVQARGTVTSGDRGGSSGRQGRAPMGTSKALALPSLHEDAFGQVLAP